MVLMKSRTLSSPSAAIFSGVSAAANSAGVALLTPASVACADSTTATSSVYGLTYCSSVCGPGLALLKRRKASSTSSGLHGFGLPGFRFFAAAVSLTVLGVAFLGVVLRAMKPV